MIRTTLNLKLDTLKKIEKISEKLGISRSKVIIMLLYKVANTRCKSNKVRSIKYQKATGQEFHVFHINYTNNSYDQFLDLRKMMKMSLSNIVNYAVYIYEEENSENNNCENNIVINSSFEYKCTLKEDLFLKTWTIIWEKNRESQH